MFGDALSFRQAFIDRPYRATALTIRTNLAGAGAFSMTRDGDQNPEKRSLPLFQIVVVIIVA
jgi:hypothetical protein